MEYGITVRTSAPFSDAVTGVREALRERASGC
jgi:hypothetical protein